MFGIGFFEFCIIAIVALVFVGPKHLPELMQQFGKFFVHMRRMSNEVKNSFDEVVHNAEAELRAEEQAKTKALALKPVSQTVSTPAPASTPASASATQPQDSHSPGETWQSLNPTTPSSHEQDPFSQASWHEAAVSPAEPPLAETSRTPTTPTSQQNP